MSESDARCCGLNVEFSMVDQVDTGFFRFSVPLTHEHR